MSTKRQNLKRRQPAQFQEIQQAPSKKRIVFDQDNDEENVNQRPQITKEKDQSTNKTNNLNQDSRIELKKILSSYITRLYCKTTAEDKKIQIINEIIQKFSGILTKLTNQRNGSKMVQACLKEGNDTQKEKIFSILLQGDFIGIIKSKYGQYVGLKMIKYMVKNQKDKFFNILLKNAYNLVSHVEGAKILDNFLREIATPHQFNLIKSFFEQKIKNKNNPTDQETIENLAIKIIEKSNHYPLLSKYILQLSLSILVPEEKEKVIDYLKDKVLDMIEDKEGIKLCIELINYASAKQRKAVVKSFKDNVCNIIKSEKSMAFVIIQKLLQTVDDTVLLEKTVLREIKLNINDLFKQKNGFIILQSIFQPELSPLKDFETDAKFTTSKKDSSQRMTEICGMVIQDIVEILQNLSEDQILKDIKISRFTTSVLEFILKNKQQDYIEFAESIIDKFLDEKQFKSENHFKTNSLLAHIDAHRVLKKIITISGDLGKKFKLIIEQKLETLNNLLNQNIDLVLQTKASFLLLALIETTSYKDFIIENIKNSGINLDKYQTINKSVELIKKYL